jgi:DNA-binding MarR family transcriptional regulator
MDAEHEVMVSPRLTKYYIDKRMSIEIDSLGITPSCGPFLVAIGRNEGISPTDLSKVMFVDKSLTTRNVKQLSDKGYVVNVGDNSRRYSLKLTESGEAAMKKIDATMKMVADDLMSTLTDEEREVFIMAITKICSKITSDINECCRSED